MQPFVQTISFKISYPITEIIANTAQAPNIPENIYRLLADKPLDWAAPTIVVGVALTLEDTTGIGGHITPAT